MCRLVVLLVLFRIFFFFFFLLREVILNSDASPGDVAAPWARSIYGIATSSAFFRSFSLSNVLEAPS